MKTRTNQPVFDDAGNLVTDDYLDEKIKTQPKLLNSIVDNQGNPRFIEGDITIETIDGVTQTYGKWSLSGTHLLIVLCLSFADTTELTAGYIATINVPDWIKEKINPVFSSVVLRQSVTLWATNYSTQSLPVNLEKYSGDIKIYNGPLTLTADRNVRIAFDLLIDTDAPEQEGE